MRLFISYAHADHKSSERIVTLLRQANHDPWFDERLVAGQDWKAVLEAQILYSDAVVLMLTAQWLASQWCQWELQQAVDASKPIIPILVEFVTLPEVLAHIQYVDMTGRISPQDAAKLIGGLAEIATKLSPSQLPDLPKGLEGKPSRAVEIVQHIKDISGGTVVGHVTSETFIAQQTIGEKSRTWTLPMILGLLIGVITIIVAIFQLLPETQRADLLYSVGMIPASPTATMTMTATPTASPTATSTVTPTQTPERMPANQFNVVVAGFAFRDQIGGITTSQVADDMSDTVYDSIRELPQIDNIRGFHANGVGHILSADPVEREQQAAAIAELLNADVVIYGLISSDGIFNTLEPEFYISARFASVEPELVGGDAFGQPIDFVGQSDDQLSAATSLQRRLRVLRLFLRGLALYIEGAFTDSRESFEEAAQIENAGLEILYVFAGNAALREPNVEAAFLSYNEALKQRPSYSRALIGRGIALYRQAIDLAGDTPPRFHDDLSLDTDVTCANVIVALPDTPQLLAELSIRCYEEAERSSDKPSTADIDVKTTFGLGQVRLWQSTIGYGQYWDDVQAYLETILSLYENSRPERQIRIRAATAHANAWLGLRLLSIDGTNAQSVTKAAEYYRTAVALLRADVNRSYDQKWIDLYTRQFEALETWLSENSPNEEIPNQT